MITRLWQLTVGVTVVCWAVKVTLEQLKERFKKPCFASHVQRHVHTFSDASICLWNQIIKAFANSLPIRTNSAPPPRCINVQNNTRQDAGLRSLQLSSAFVYVYTCMAHLLQICTYNFAFTVLCGTVLWSFPQMNISIWWHHTFSSCVLLCLCTSGCCFLIERVELLVWVMCRHGSVTMC